jgi:ATP-dependent Clp protease, protease subunit
MTIQQPQPAAQGLGAVQALRVYISFSAEINTKTTESLLAVVADQVTKGAQEIYLLLSTPGGSVMNGINLYNVLRGLPCKIITHNVGNVNSIGNTVFLAGEERYACSNATFMFHGVGFDAKDGTRFEEKSLKERLDGLLQDQKRIGDIIAARTTLGQSEIGGLFLEAQTKDATYARANGIIHDIRDVQIPKGTPILQLVFQR